MSTERKSTPWQPAKPLVVELTFLEPLLGTLAGNPETASEYIASKRPDGVDPAEIAAIPPLSEDLQKSSTVFPRDPAGNPIIWDYQVKGFFKDACSMLARVPDTRSKGLKAYKKVIDGTVFVGPRQIPLVLPSGGELTFCERPLRAQTAQGERIALARSEEAPVGTKLTFEVNCLNADNLDDVAEWLSYGKLRGLGQWRNSGKGRFAYRIVE